MRNRGRKWYWLTLVAVASVSVAYALHNDVYGRYLEQERAQRDIETRRAAVQAKEIERNRAQKRVENLVKSSLEIETAIRERKRFVREGEVVYHLEEMPVDNIGQNK